VLRVLLVTAKAAILALVLTALFAGGLAAVDAAARSTPCFPFLDGCPIMDACINLQTGSTRPLGTVISIPGMVDCRCTGGWAVCSGWAE
jgi:hypothetical protein